jgi:hypothetical protein
MRWGISLTASDSTRDARAMPHVLRPRRTSLLGFSLAATTVLFGLFLTLASAADSQTVQLVGRWERVTTCQGLVDALNKAGMRALAPVMIAGNGLVPGTPQELARKANICAGARPRLHSHFFDGNGQFGSLDWNGQQVDDGPYRVQANRTVRIGSGLFRYRITSGELSLSPIISREAKRRALARPLQFSTPGWMVAVAYGGLPWKRVPCGRWC